MASGIAAKYAVPTALESGLVRKLSRRDRPLLVVGPARATADRPQWVGRSLGAGRRSHLVGRSSVLFGTGNHDGTVSRRASNRGNA